MRAVQKVGLYSLLALMVFALVFAFLPSADHTSTQTGATLRDVQLTLYPARDPDAVWQFQAANVTNDPITSVTELSGLSGGERLVRVKDKAGQYTGAQTLDATLTTPHLTINAQDDLTTPSAEIYLLNSCAQLNLIGDQNNPVRIEQGYGFSTPLAVVKSPYLNGRITKMRMTFDFKLEDSGTDSVTSFPLDPTEDCVKGKVVPIAHS